MYSFPVSSMNASSSVGPYTWPVEDDNLGAGFGGAFQTVHHGPNKCVDAGPHILKINQQHVDVAEPLGFWLPGLAVERIDPEPGGPVDGVSGLNHVVLLFTEETVLGRKEAAELTGKGAHDAVARVDKMPVRRGLIGKQTQSFAEEGGWPVVAQGFNSQKKHGVLNRYCGGDV